MDAKQINQSAAAQYPPDGVHMRRLLVLASARLAVLLVPRGWFDQITWRFRFRGSQSADRRAGGLNFP
ncbi:hypothetical protein QZN06_02265 [Burkholderia multivorans]|uniref:hypothetical protein n=1 Tax=Burkholderia multivorans TaxID=87883 RepID=UPI0012FDC21B|nr:hypothetical protein [Burkholderia multivorans]MBJ9657815.1 hypothetical protein [Burkholderia multivorans]MBU9472685.1 hypothetical protein [Burkholderia multivorans]MDN8007386.1 hypothetical protein [Burkholderia multivorans]